MIILEEWGGSSVVRSGWWGESCVWEFWAHPDSRGRAVMSGVGRLGNGGMYKLQGHIVQHREYSQYFIITINAVQPLKIVNHCVVHL